MNSCIYYVDGICACARSVQRQKACERTTLCPVGRTEVMMPLIEVALMTTTCSLCNSSVRIGTKCECEK